MASTPPPTPPPPDEPTRRQDYGRLQLDDIARLPIPGNAELLIWVLMLLLIALVALIADTIDSPFWVDFAKWTTAAYLISRGIAN
jgi:hypothetical protein